MKKNRPNSLQKINLNSSKTILSTSAKSAIDQNMIPSKLSTKIALIILMQFCKKGNLMKMNIFLTNIGMVAQLVERKTGFSSLNLSNHFFNNLFKVGNEHVNL